MKNQAHVALQIGAFFGWLLSLPLYGPLLQRLDSLRSTPPAAVYSPERIQDQVAERSTGSQASSIAPGTLKTHTNHIHSKLGVSGRQNLLLLALGNGQDSDEVV